MLLVRAPLMDKAAPHLIYQTGGLDRAVHPGYSSFFEVKTIEIESIFLSFVARIYGFLTADLCYSKKDSESNDIFVHFEEFSNEHNNDRSSNATQSNLSNKNV